MRILIFLALGLGCLLSGFTASGQADNLMIVEYEDSDPGSGWAVELFNPTSAPINLASYHIKVYGNGNTTPISDFALSGILQPCSTRIVGNTAYCQSCSCGINDNWQGVNSNDAIVLTFGAGNNFVDMVGRYGSNNSITVAGVNNALEHHRLVRSSTNLIRYSQTNSTNSWPSNPSTNVTGWSVFSPGCLQPGFTPAPPTVNLGLDQTLCNNQSITLDAGNANTGSTYAWSNGATTQTISVNTPGQYSVTVTKACATSTDVITIFGANAGPDQAACPGDTVTLALGNNVQDWSGGSGVFIPSLVLEQTLYVVGPNDLGQVTLQVSKPASCGTATDAMILTVGDPDQVNSALSVSPNPIQMGLPATFTVNTPAGHLFGNETWDFGDGTGAFSGDTVTHTYAVPGAYIVTFSYKQPCPFQLTLPVTVEGTLNIPNVFTPDGDQLNDEFTIQLPGTSAYYLKIFNRWGQLQFETTDKNKSWDGKNVPDGVYYMHLEATLVNGQSFSFRQPISLISSKK